MMKYVDMMTMRNPLFYSPIVGCSIFFFEFVLIGVSGRKRGHGLKKIKK